MHGVHHLEVPRTTEEAPSWLGIFRNPEGSGGLELMESKPPEIGFHEIHAFEGLDFMKSRLPELWIS